LGKPRTLNIRRGPVDFDLKDLLNKNKLDKYKFLLLLLKRYAFKYEKKFRIMLIPKKRSGYFKGIEIKYDKGSIHELINEAIREVIPEIKDISAENADALIKIAVPDFFQYAERKIIAHSVYGRCHWFVSPGHFYDVGW